MHTSVHCWTIGSGMAYVQPAACRTASGEGNLRSFQNGAGHMCGHGKHCADVFRLWGVFTHVSKEIRRKRQCATWITEITRR
jgi:hypothetical protein